MLLTNSRPLGSQSSLAHFLQMFMMTLRGEIEPLEPGFHWGGGGGGGGGGVLSSLYRGSSNGNGQTDGGN